MNIINLGTVGQPRKSALSGMSEALSSGFNRGMVQGATIAEAKAKQAALSMELAKMNIDQQNKNTEMGYKLLTDYSAKVNSMDPTMRGIFEESPEAKEITKVIKKYTPDFIGEDGKVMVLGKMDMAKDAMENRKNQIEAKLAAGGIESLTQGEKDFVSYMKGLGPDMAAQVFTAATSDIRWLSADAAQKAEIIAEYTKQAQGFQNPMITALRRPVGGGATMTEANDPLGLRKAQA